MPDIGTPPWVSVVIPARDAARTLAETLESLLAQTDPRWEAFVVDDDSRDDTRMIAERYASGDDRFTVVSSLAHSEGGARNIGIGASHAPWLLFLDADDLIDAETLKLVSTFLESDPAADGVVYGWLRFTSDGRTGARDYWDDTTDPFEIAATHTPFPIHACIVRRSVVVNVGMFDGSLAAAADWDLWQRVFRASARIVRLRGTLARYRTHTSAMSADPQRMFEAGLGVLDRAYRPDGRVRTPAPAYAAGRDRHHRRQALLGHICWWGGVAIASGADATPIIESAAEDLATEPSGAFHIEPLALGLAGSIRVWTLTSWQEWPSLWAGYGDAIRAFFTALERVGDAAGSAWRAELLLAPAEADMPRRRGDAQAIDIELTCPIGAIKVDPGVERVIAVGRVGGRPLGMLELPATSVVVEGSLRDAAADRWHWELCRHFLERTGRIEEGADDDEAWTALFEELWWCDADADAISHTVRIGWRRPIEIVIGRPLPRIIIARRRSVPVQLRVGQVRLPVVRLSAHDAESPDRTARTLTIAYGSALFRAIAAEALIGRGWSGSSLRSTLLRRARGGPETSELSDGGRSP